MSIFSAQAQARGASRKLIFLFALTVLALLVGVNAGLALMWWPLTRLGFAYPESFFAVNTAVTLLLVLGGWWIESSNLAQGGEKLARRVGARELWDSRAHEVALRSNLQEMLIASRLPLPQLMVLDREECINAFAAGWDTTDAVIVVTRGALEQLTREELQGMLAHELAHIREGDTRLNMRLSGMVFGLELVFNFGQTLCEPNDEGQRSASAIPGVVVMAVGALGWLAGRWLRSAVARQREFLADARALQYTRSKNGLGGALRKVQRLALDGRAAMRFAHPAVQHMWLVGAAPEAAGQSGDWASDVDDGTDSDDQDGGGGPTALLAGKAAWLDNHPPLAQRIARVYGRAMPPLPRERSKPVLFPE